MRRTYSFSRRSIGDLTSGCLVIFAVWLAMFLGEAKASYNATYSTTIGGGTTAVDPWELKIRVKNILFVAGWDVNGWRRGIYENGARIYTTTICYTSRWNRFWGNANGAMITRSVSAPMVLFTGYQWKWLKASLGVPPTNPKPPRDDYIEDGFSIGLLSNVVGQIMQFDGNSLPPETSLSAYLNEFGGRYGGAADIFELVAGSIDAELLTEEPQAILLQQTLMAISTDFDALASALSSDAMLPDNAFDELLAHTIALRDLVPVEQQFLAASIDEMVEDLSQMSQVLQGGFESLDEAASFVDAFSHYSTDTFLTMGDRFSNHVSSVPEPAFLLLLAIGIGGVFGGRRRRSG